MSEKRGASCGSGGPAPYTCRPRKQMASCLCSPVPLSLGLKGEDVRHPPDAGRGPCRVRRLLGPGGRPGPASHGRHLQRTGWPWRLCWSSWSRGLQSPRPTDSRSFPFPSWGAPSPNHFSFMDDFAPRQKEAHGLPTIGNQAWNAGCLLCGFLPSHPLPFLFSEAGWFYGWPRGLVAGASQGGYRRMLYPHLTWRDESQFQEALSLRQSLTRMNRIGKYPAWREVCHSHFCRFPRVCIFLYVIQF